MPDILKDIVGRGDIGKVWIPDIARNIIYNFSKQQI